MAAQVPNTAHVRGEAESVRYHITIHARSPQPGILSTFDIKIVGPAEDSKQRISYSGKFHETRRSIDFQYICKNVGDINAVYLKWHGYQTEIDLPQGSKKTPLRLHRVIIAHGEHSMWKFDFNRTIQPGKEVFVVKQSRARVNVDALFQDAREGRIRNLVRLKRDLQVRLINRVNIQGRTPLQVAIECERVEFVRYLLEEDLFSDVVYIWPGDEKQSKSTKINYVKNRMLSPLHEACKASVEAHAEMMVRLLLRIAEKRGRKKKQYHDPQSKGREESYMVGVLRMQDGKGWTPLHYAARYDRQNIINEFIKRDRGAAFIEDDLKRTPLILACQKGARVESILSLINAMEHTNQALTKGLGTYVHSLAKRGDPILVEGLFRRGKISKKALTSTDDAGRTPLLCAIESANVDCVRAIANMGNSEWRAHDKGYNGVLHLAAMNGGEALFRYLASRREVHLSEFLKNKNRHGDTPLHVALRYHNHPAIVWLYKNGADPLQKNKQNKTAEQLFRELNLDGLSASLSGLNQHEHRANIDDHLYQALFGSLERHDTEDQMGIRDGHEMMASRKEYYDIRGPVIPDSGHNGGGVVSKDPVEIYQKIRYLQRRLDRVGPRPLLADGRQWRVRGGAGFGGQRNSNRRGQCEVECVLS
ncbi:hypothetical protein AAMO2058_001235000 [Amorphochlora amoebiformis]